MSRYRGGPLSTLQNHSASYQTLLAKGLTRSLVAVRAQEGSTRTGGYILLQLIFGILTWGGFDRLLSGPTSEVWLSPWTQYLSQKGVQFQSDTTVKAFKTDASGITGVTIEQAGQQTDIVADYLHCGAAG